MRLMMPESSLSPRSREKTFTPIIRPRLPFSMRFEVSFTSRAFSPKRDRSRRSSGASCVSPFGGILPTRMSPGRTSAPMRTTPTSPTVLSYFKDENVARAHFSADAHNAVLVQVFELCLADIRNVVSGYFRSEFRIAHVHDELLNVNAGDPAVLAQPL